MDNVHFVNLECHKKIPQRRFFYPFSFSHVDIDLNLLRATS